MAQKRPRDDEPAEQRGWRCDADCKVRCACGEEPQPKRMCGDLVNATQRLPPCELMRELAVDAMRTALSRMPLGEAYKLVVDGLAHMLQIICPVSAAMWTELTTVRSWVIVNRKPCKWKVVHVAEVMSRLAWDPALTVCGGATGGSCGDGRAHLVFIDACRYITSFTLKPGRNHAAHQLANRSGTPPMHKKKAGSSRTASPAPSSSGSTACGSDLDSCSEVDAMECESSPLVARAESRGSSTPVPPPSPVYPMFEIPPCAAAAPEPDHVYTLGPACTDVYDEVLASNTITEYDSFASPLSAGSAMEGLRRDVMMGPAVQDVLILYIHEERYNVSSLDGTNDC